ncbi:MAG: hypothetical protein A2632_02630 [Candidatus Pacebacteria bacterium RIFCSPHIGHO2_01_FULL_46_16]|nr:MAG: hypothetical protein A2632_02630 [Candidatus Pacebacteria bacterium RIFCSPHIGHO2_01_FULL_46_16]OGJ21222.1 MAG: hypothetical protein A3J60_02475 [Candidatus Pacebacteria bacterium RIFCSPHIGHO2_02_FULL_46_9]OGJ38275.1 MAG: hypothetical protein A3A82_01590 [Candidatus Pacebacteria bacterium RIFCSPLOWO2_01_FULL_47_12]
MSSAIFILYQLVWLLAYFAGLLWWVGLLQQKEYRLDRLLAHLRSLSIRQMILHLLPVLAVTQPTLFKRPVKTFRAMLLLLASWLIGTWFVYTLLPWSKAVPALVVTRSYLVPVLRYMVAPAVVLVLTVLTSGLVWLVTTGYLLGLQRVLSLKKIFIIGITGSFGKTTTKQLLVHMLAQHGAVCTTPGSVNTALGIARYVLKNLGNAETLVLEYAAYQMDEIARLAAVIPPDMAIITGLGAQHLELFGSKQAIAKAKAELLLALPDAAPVFCCSQSAEQVVAMAANKNTLQITATWLHPAAKLLVLPNQYLQVRFAGTQITTTIIGNHYGNTVLSVVAVSQQLGLTDKQIVAGLQTFVPTEKWIRRRTTPFGISVIDDGGTSNPDGFLAALNLLAEHPQPRKILLTAGIVDLGSQSRAIHSRLAQAAAVCVSEVWYLGEVGRQAFAEHFPTNLVTDKQLMIKNLHTVDPQTIILLEGRLPAWLAKYL